MGSNPRHQHFICSVKGIKHKRLALEEGISSRVVCLRTQISVRKIVGAELKSNCDDWTRVEWSALANGDTFVVVRVVHVVGLHEHCAKYNQSVIVTKRFVLNVDLALIVGGSYGEVG